MSTLSINLENSDQRFVQEAVQSGRYATESEVIADALAELKAHEQSVRAEITVLRHEVEEGLAQLDRGEVEEWSLEDAQRAARESFAQAHR